jgi:hypothetical protein
MAIPTYLYGDVKATAEFARDMALGARRSIGDNPRTRTAAEQQVALDALAVVATRANQVLQVIASEEVEANG